MRARVRRALRPDSCAAALSLLVFRKAKTNSLLFLSCSGISGHWVVSTLQWDMCEHISMIVQANGYRAHCRQKVAVLITTMQHMCLHWAKAQDTYCK